WAALENRGAPELLRRGQEYLERLEGVEDPAMVRRRDELGTKFKAQLDMAHDTLRGVLPGDPGVLAVALAVGAVAPGPRRQARPRKELLNS
ncbi:hypothetical protein OAF93_02220, partial [Planctomycetota bacterium]|nr:hypothetical protein [Planctomycetota bacterium]